MSQNETTTANQTTPVTHWKKLTNPNYIGAHDFQPGQELTLQSNQSAMKWLKTWTGKMNHVLLLE